MGNATAAIMGGFMGAQMKLRKDCVKALEEANANSSQTAKTLAEVGFIRNSCEKSVKQAVEHLVKKKSIIQIGDKFYLNPER